MDCGGPNTTAAGGGGEHKGEDPSSPASVLWQALPPDDDIRLPRQALGRYRVFRRHRFRRPLHPTKPVPAGARRSARASQRRTLCSTLALFALLILVTSASTLLVAWTLEECRGAVEAEIGRASMNLSDGAPVPVPAVMEEEMGTNEDVEDQIDTGDDDNFAFAVDEPPADSIPVPDATEPPPPIVCSADGLCAATQVRVLPDGKRCGGGGDAADPLPSGAAPCAGRELRMMHDMKGCEDARHAADSLSLAERLHPGGLVHSILRVNEACRYAKW